MDAPLIELPLEAARAAIARVFLGDAIRGRRVGPVTLRPHQVEAAARAEVLLRTHRGALIADDVGLGKTYVALAVAAHRRTVIVCPAALLGMWRDALRRCRLDARLISHESLSRGPPATDATHDLVIVDEAHHARNPATARYRRLATLTAHCGVLLLSATPVHNHHRDLCALLALFLGARAWSLPEAELTRCVVRRAHDEIGGSSSDLPIVEATRDLRPHDDALDPGTLLALPSPVPPRDGGRADALLALGLVHRWASSRGALEESLRRRLARAIALEAALADGTYPSRGQLARWLTGGDAVQLGFSGLLAAAAGGDVLELLASVKQHAEGVRALLSVLERTADPDDDRARLLRELRKAHPGDRIVAFTQFAGTAAAYWRRLRGHPGVAMLTAAGARIAGGPLTREEVLARFAPRAHSMPEPRDIERIDLLIATDLLSEGVNLQDAGVVVHLDTPWTPARMQQRIGRVARIGSSHARVHSYRMAPPADAERILALERRLGAKLREAGRTVGMAGFITPSLGAPLEAHSPARAQERIRALLRDWTGSNEQRLLVRGDSVRFAYARADRDLALALVEQPDGPAELLAEMDGHVTSDPVAVARACELLSSAPPPACTADHTHVHGVLSRLNRWLSRSAGADCIDLGLAAERRERTPVLQRITSIASRAPYHRRSAIAPLAMEARRAAIASYGIGAQRVLVELAAAPMDDEAWLRAVAAFGSANAKQAGSDGRRTISPRRITVILVSIAG